MKGMGPNFVREYFSTMFIASLKIIFKYRIVPIAGPLVLNVTNEFFSVWGHKAELKS